MDVRRELKGLRLRKLVCCEKGTFTLEASLVLPVILLSTILLLFLGLYVFQTSSAYQTAGLAADRAAFVWDNSRKDPVTGAFNISETDGLYWRLHNDSMSDLFRWLIPHAGAKVALPTTGISNDRGPEGKLQHAGALVSSEWDGSMMYQNNGIFKKVAVQLEKPFHSPVYARERVKQQVASDADAQVVDPVEWIRLIDFTRTVVQEIQGRIKPKDALLAMVEPQSIPEPRAVITSHDSAANYLRTLVNGKEETIQVDASTKRTVDAMDANRVAHQAFYTFNENQLRTIQMPKDEQLLRNGTQVKGVVWHFFKLSKKDQVKLTQGLRSELERKGIVVVLHE
ncbi:hypothetical protein [Paenibacillus rigui]|uniref:hypothetical protein n=1 Tax=Paenibacillus rigui TaxID=554312 RepID=UPI001FE954C2|nr:hypothetical protein [Paenibacillus rigui]